ncbi:MAG TPA: hypothetical protein PLL44_07105, partial [Novosphingobium sp.]|nr:hypothetical protein [Novosphingobium sp.]
MARAEPGLVQWVGADQPSGAVGNGHGQVAAIDARLAQFQNLNWTQLNEQDPVQAQALLIEQMQLKQARRVAEHQVQQL